MSTERGNGSRTRAQKYKNRVVFKNDLHDKTPQQKKLNSLHISEVCMHCKEVIEWKIKYKKYKPLTQPKTCVQCQQKNIRKAYHVLCRDCALAQKVCAKCLKNADECEIEPAGPSREEEIKLKAEMDRLIRSLPERKRRAFQRFMRKGNIVEEKEEEQSEEKEAQGAEGDDDDEVTLKPTRRIPHTREVLLKKIQELKDGDGSDDENDYDYRVHNIQLGMKWASIKDNFVFK